MIKIRFRDFAKNEFGFDIHVPKGRQSVPVKKVFDLCGDYLKTLTSISDQEFDTFTFSDGLITIEFDKAEDDK